MRNAYKIFMVTILRNDSLDQICESVHEKNQIKGKGEGGRTKLRNLTLRALHQPGQ